MAKTGPGHYLHDVVCIIPCHVYVFSLSDSHLVTAHPGPLLSDILLSSPILTDEEGAPLAPLGQGFEFGIDPTEDPELAMVHTQTYMQFSKSHSTCM